MPNKRTGPDYLDKSVKKYKKKQKAAEKKHKESIKNWPRSR